MNILVLNCGSSSVKFQLIATDLEQYCRQQLIAGSRAAAIERIGGEAIVTLEATGHEPVRSTATLRDTRAAVEFIIRWACSARIRHC